MNFSSFGQRFFSRFTNTPTRPPSTQNPTVAYPFRHRKADNEREVYATQMETVLKPTVREHNVMRQLHLDFVARFKKSPRNTSEDSFTKSQIGITEIDYDKIYKSGMKSLKKSLVAGGMQLPSWLNKITYTENEHSKRIKSNVYNLSSADHDQKLNAVGRFELRRLLAEEKKLIYFKKLRNFAMQTIKSDVEKMTGLFVQSANGKDVELLAKSVGALNAFFEKNFQVRLKNSYNLAVQKKFNQALISGSAKDIDKVLMQHLDQLMEKLPSGRIHDSIDQHDGNSNGSILTLARAVAQERIAQTKLASTSKIQSMIIGGGSSYLERCNNGKQEDFKLRQAYGQEDGEKITYELMFKKSSADSNRESYDLSLKRINSDGDAQSIPLKSDAWDVLKQHFAKSDLTLLFGEGKNLHNTGFDALIGHCVANGFLEDSIENILSRHIDAAIDKTFAEKNITNFQGTGFSYNNGLFGENLAIDCRSVVLGRILKKSGKGEIATSGSCGYQQDLIWNAGGHIIAVQDVTGKAFLPDPNHGNDPFTVDEKESYQSVTPNTARAGEYELPVGNQEIDANDLRLISNLNPIPPAKQHSLHIKGNSQLAATRTAWEARDAVPLSISIADRENEIRSSIVRFHDQAVMGSSNLKLSSATDNAGRQIPLNIENGNYVLSSTHLAQLAQLELSHELPEKFALHDDEGKLISDANGDPVRLLEKVILQPKKSISITNNTNHVEFEISHIERWIRVPLEHKSNKDRAKTKGDHVLCTYEKVIQNIDQGNLDPRVLRDQIYTTINCVHSQNGIHSASDQFRPGVELVSYSVKPNDEQYGREFILASSKANPRTHPIAVDPRQLKESLISEAMQINVGSGVATVTHQAHSDMFKEEGGHDHEGKPLKLNPYLTSKITHEVKEEFRGQRQGNKESIQTGIYMQERRALMSEIKNAKTKKGKSTDALDFLTGRGAMHFDIVTSTRHPNALKYLVNLLNETDHPVLIEAAARLARPTKIFNRLGASIDGLEAAIHDALKVELGKPNGISVNRSFIQAQALVADLRRRVTALEKKVNGISGAELEIDQSIIDINSSLSAIRNALFSDTAKMRNSHFGMLEPALNNASSAVLALSHWESFPASVFDDAKRQLSALAKHDEAHLSLRDFSNDQLASDLEEIKARNDKLYSRYRQTDPNAAPSSAQLIYQLFGVNDYLENEESRYWEDKNLLVQRLEIRHSTLSISTDEEAIKEVKEIEQTLNAWRIFAKSVRRTDHKVVDRSQSPDSAQEAAINRNILPINSATKYPSSTPLEQTRAVETQTIEDTESLLFQQAVEVAFKPSAGIDKEEWIDKACDYLIDIGLLKSLESPTASKADLVLTLKALMRDDNRHAMASLANEVSQKMAQTEYLSQQLMALKEMLDASSAPNAAPIDAEIKMKNQQRHFRPYPERGWAIASGLKAGMAMNAVPHGVYDAILGFAEGLSHTAELALHAAPVADSILFGAILAGAGIEASKNAVYAQRRLKAMKRSFEDDMRNIQETQDALCDAIRNAKEALIAGHRSTLGASPQTFSAIQAVQTIVNQKAEIIDLRLKVIKQDLNTKYFDLATAPVLPVAAAAVLGGKIVGMAAANSASMASAAAVTSMATGIIGSGVLTAYGLAQTAKSARELLKTQQIDHEVTSRGLVVDSAIRRAYNAHKNQRNAALKFQISNWSAFTAGAAMLTAGAAVLPTPAAPAAIPLGIVGGTLVAGSVATGIIDPKRERRGRTMWAGESTTHLSDDFLINNRRRNRLVSNLNAQGSLVRNAIEKIVERAIGSKSYAFGDFRHTFNKTKTLRWFSEDFHRSKLADAIAKHPDETKDFQFDLMHRTNIAEINYVEFEVNERKLEIDAVGKMIMQLQSDSDQHDMPVLTGALQAQLQKMLDDLKTAQSRLSALKDLNEKLTLFGVELYRDFRTSTRQQFEHLKVRYMVAHELLVDAMSRDEIRALVQAHEWRNHEEPSVLDAELEGATIQGQAYIKAQLSDQSFIGNGLEIPKNAKIQSVNFSTTESAYQWVHDAMMRLNHENKMNTVNTMFARMMCSCLPDKIAYESTGLMNLHQEAMRKEARKDIEAAVEMSPVSGKPV